MKNRYDYLKAKFGAWLKLKHKTGHVYNPTTNTFNLSQEEWQLEMKHSNKHVESLRSAPLPFPDLCTQLFEGATSTGFDGWGPTSTLFRPTQDYSIPSFNDFDDTDCTEKEPVATSENLSGHSKKQGAKRKNKDMATSKDTSKERMLKIGIIFPRLPRY